MHFAILEPYARAVHADPMTAYLLFLILGYVFLEAEEAVRESHWMPRCFMKGRTRYYRLMNILSVAATVLLFVLAQCFFQS